MKEQLLSFLLETQNQDGGWGYFPGRRSALEPTSYALLALQKCSEHRTNSLRAVAFVKSRQTVEGGWPAHSADTEAAPWVCPLAGFSLLTTEGLSPSCLQSAAFVISSFGTMPRSWFSRLLGWIGKSEDANLDTNLGGWSWNFGTARWVEPTCYSLIFLKRVQRATKLPNDFPASVRQKLAFNPDQLISVIAEGESLVYDRMCRGGGWNYGNSKVLGQDLRPYALTTALALIALHDHPERAENRSSLAYLTQAVQSEKSSLSLCYACLCLDLYSKDWVEFVEALTSWYQQTRFFNGVKTAALALLVLEAEKGRNAFGVPT